MEREGGGIVAAAPTSPRRLSSQHSTLRDSFIASDLAEGMNCTTVVNCSSNSRSQRPVSNLTLGDVLNGGKKSPPSNNNVVVRTLLEIIHNGETLNTGGGGGSSNRRKTWKSFKEKLKCKKRHSHSHSHNQNQNLSSRRSGSSTGGSQSDSHLGSRTGRDALMNRNSLGNNSIRRADGVPANSDLSLMEVDGAGSPRSGGSFRLSTALAAEREHTRRRLSRELDEEGIDVSGQGAGEDEEDGPFFDAPVDQPVRMSLMELLEETDRQAGISGPTYRIVDVKEEEEEEEVAKEIGKAEFSCCVCMVRHKGAAFIPCGHTFCRLCSRELFVQRGNCPLCNNFILEILDIF
ncbi:uncharacterized protein LOC141607454 [Silene latifolia]|uniref:uncharacterized protein LOC141607454 n=1 Tax=Silene latifolia TaxID=37657 RepID=UPI003D77F70D